MWVITFALTLIISMGGAYAYFTATASKKQSEMTTGIIRVGLTDTQLTASNLGSSSSTKILPGSTIKYSGNVQNTGNTDMYAVLEFSVYIEGTEDPIQTTYYSAAGTKLVYSDSKQEFVTVGATQIAAGAFQHFELDFKFDSSLDNRYKTKTATVIVTAHAIQYRNIENAVQAVNLPLSKTGGGITRLPSNYTQLQYVEAAGNQWFDTDIAYEW